MNKVAVNFICKNEAHIIERMLRSARPIADMIVVVDTGSTDDTIQRIKDFGEKEGLPTYVFSRPFDNFCNSRNYALDQLKGKAADAGWDLDQAWGFTIDCDEWVTFLPAFRKENLYADFYVIRQRIGRQTYTRHGLYKLSKDIFWESPIHETLVYSDPTIVKEYEFNIELVEENAGASWKGDLEAKFLRYAVMLKAYLNEGHYNFRTIFFIGDSYNAAAGYAKDPARAREYYELADHYFLLAAKLESSSPEVRFMLYKKIGENRQAMGKPWPEIMDAFLIAFLEYPAKAETFAVIIEHYIDEKKWELAHWYSQFSYHHFVLAPIGEKRVLYNDESLYQWRLLFCYYYTALQSGRKEEAANLYKRLRKIIKETPAYFSEEDLMLIHIHSPMILRVQRWRQSMKRHVSRLIQPGYAAGNSVQPNQSVTPKRIYYAA